MSPIARPSTAATRAATPTTRRSESLVGKRALCRAVRLKARCSPLQTAAYKTYRRRSLTGAVQPAFVRLPVDADGDAGRALVVVETNVAAARRPDERGVRHVEQVVDVAADRQAAIR